MKQFLTVIAGMLLICLIVVFGYTVGFWLWSVLNV